MGPPACLAASATVGLQEFDVTFSEFDLVHGVFDDHQTARVREFRALETEPAFSF